MLERSNNKVYEIPEGFIVYSIDGDRAFIHEIYVDSDFRLKGFGRLMADMVTGIAQESNCKWLYGSVWPQAKQATESMKAIIAYGFKLDSSSENCILFRKEI